MKTLACLLICAMLTASVFAREAKSLPSAQRAVIEHARLAQNAAIIRHDIEAIAAVWTDDVTICRGLGTQLAGKPAYRQLFMQDVGSPAEIVYQRHPTVIDVSEIWPLAFESGVWEGHKGTAAGDVVVRGRYSAQWVKRGDAWLIRSEVFVALQGAGAGLEMKAVP